MYKKLSTLHVQIECPNFKTVKEYTKVFIKTKKVLRLRGLGSGWTNVIK